MRVMERGGFFFGIGAGYGSNWISCSEPAATCSSTTQANGFAGFFKIGAHLNETFGVAFETNGWCGRATGPESSTSIPAAVISCCEGDWDSLPRNSASQWE